ncbi:ciliary microtubule associated protein 1A [Hetaerina americana]|uniref:ciliary microtubule associated protein 1A n=1 Tax=Hetaerina americana TaxID=62018 RepID=UPI003A7F625E
MSAVHNKPIKIMARETGPGPGVYHMPPTVGYEGHDFTKFRSPAYTIGHKPSPLRKFVVPGPQWIEPGTTRFGPATRNPGFSMAPKYPPLKAFGSPGPAAYSLEKSTQANGPRSPAYTIAGRHDLHRKDVSPGPNAYILPSTIGLKVPDKPTSAAYSIGSRRPELSKYGSPGPAAYTSPNLYTYKPRAPGYTMATRTRLPGERSAKPGPNAYFPMYNTNQRAPEFSFGVKHSDYQAPFKLSDDCH